MEASEIAQLRRRIAQEEQAAVQGLSGLAQGTAQHRTIVSKLERLTLAAIREHGYERGMQVMMHRLEEGLSC